MFFYQVAPILILLIIHQQIWAFQFVVWDGYIYQLSDEYVESIDEKIGEVTKYFRYARDRLLLETSQIRMKKGTKYYAIQGISTDEAIAIEEKGKYRKAIRDGKYGGK